jgi:hypothetical protein
MIDREICLYQQPEVRDCDHFPEEHFYKKSVIYQLYQILLETFLSWTLLSVFQRLQAYPSRNKNFFIEVMKERTAAVACVVGKFHYPHFCLRGHE